MTPGTTSLHALPTHTVLDLFAAQSQQNPHAVAVIAPSGQQLSYIDLRDSAERLASALIAAGVGADARVGIYLHRDLDLIVAVVAVLMAGGACVPLDESYPAHRLQYIAEDSSLSIVLTKSAIGVDFLPDGVRRWNIDEPHRDMPRASLADVQVDASSLAYVIYTSGSTGQPKGVAMPHASLVNLITWQNARSVVAPGARTLQFAPIGFDVSFQEIFATITSGGALVLIDNVTRSDPGRLTECLAEFRVGRLFLPFVALQQLALWAQQHAIELRSLREVNTAGEVLQSTPAIVDFFSRHPDCVLDNQYGPTETHVVTAHRLDGPPALWPARPPIGHAIPEVETYVLDDSQRVVEEGHGELCIGGIALARGYLGNPELTADRFVILPWVSSHRLYRTGDLVRRQADGTLHFIGRSDHQVKLRGHRIELSEIESVLGSHPDVVGCVAYVVTFGEFDQRLVAALVLAKGRALAPHQLRTFMRERLPEYMVPSALVSLERFPLTSSGKVDRSAMPRPTTSGNPEPAVAPRDDIEQRLVNLWSELLHVHGLSTTDDFFEAGGDSLLAVRLFVEIEGRFGQRLPMSTLIQANTVQRLAAVLRGERPELTKPTIVAVNDVGNGVPFFWIHGLSGSVAEFVQIGRVLGPDVRTFGIETTLDAGVPDYADSIAETAAHHVAALTAFYPDGPFFLGGWSAGATLALEMASRLEALGRQPLAIVSFDGAPFNSGAERSRLSPLYWLKVLGNVPSWVVNDLSHTSPTDLGGRVYRKLVSLARQAIAGRNAVAGHTAEIEGFLDISRATIRQQEFMRRQYHALREYVPPRYAGRVILYRAATHPLGKLHEYERIWRRLGADLETVMVRGTHLQVVTPTSQISSHLRARVTGLVADTRRLASRSPRRPHILPHTSTRRDNGAALEA